MGFISLFTYAQRLLKPTDLPEWRLPKLDDCPKLKIWLFGYNQKFATITRLITPMECFTFRLFFRSLDLFTNHSNELSELSKGELNLSLWDWSKRVSWKPASLINIYGVMKGFQSSVGYFLYSSHRNKLLAFDYAFSVVAWYSAQT